MGVVCVTVVVIFVLRRRKRRKIVIHSPAIAMSNLVYGGIILSYNTYNMQSAVYTFLCFLTQLLMTPLPKKSIIPVCKTPSSQQMTPMMCPHGVKGCTKQSKANHLMKWYEMKLSENSYSICNARSTYTCTQSTCFGADYSEIPEWGVYVPTEVS